MKKIRKWTEYDSFDDIIARLDEIENHDFGDDVIFFATDPKTEKYKAYPPHKDDPNKRVQIVYRIGRFYTDASIWICKGHLYYNDSLLFHSGNPEEKRYKSKKAATVAMINVLERFVSDPKIYRDFRKKFVKWYENLCK